MEIHRLHDMLTEAGIDHEWRDRTPPEVKGLIFDDLVDNPRPITKINWGWQVLIKQPNSMDWISAIEGYGSYGFDEDLIEMWDFKEDEPRGWLTAEEVFRRIKEVVEWLK